jgi:hypothetical protein
VCLGDLEKEKNVLSRSEIEASLTGARQYIYNKREQQRQL